MISLFYTMDVLHTGKQPQAASGVEATKTKLHKLGDFSIEGFGGGCRCPTVNNFAFLVNQKLFKVPLGESEIDRLGSNGSNEP